MLNDSSWACCTPVDAASHHHDDEAEHSHDSGHEDEENTLPEPYPTPDCSGCTIVKAGFTSATVDFHLPAPVLLDFVPVWDDLYLRIQRILSWAEEAQESPPAWSMDHVLETISEIVSTSAISVRGPNLV